MTDAGDFTCNDLENSLEGPIFDGLLVAEYWGDPNARSCQCEPTPVGTFKAVCDHCDICNDSNTVCATYELTWEGDTFGNIVTIDDVVQYAKGRNEQIRFSYRGDGPNVETWTCGYSVNGELCQTCEYRTNCARNVDEGGIALYVDCTNLPNGEIFDRCVEDYTSNTNFNGFMQNLNDEFACSSDINVAPPPTPPQLPVVVIESGGTTTNLFIPLVILVTLFLIILRI